MTLPPWSFSMIEKFENCPRSAFHKYILKEKEPPSPEIEYGNAVHKALENRVRSNIVLAADFAAWEPFAASIVQSAGQPYAELKLGINRAMQPCGFFDAAVWGRSAADIVVIKGDLAWVGDWKTGKKREKELQVKICAMFIFKHYPQVQRIHACNIWLKPNEIGELYRFYREKETDYWVDILQRVQKMEQAMELNYWPEKPSGLCGWCSVKTCKYNRS